MITKEEMQNARLSYTVAFKRFTTQFDKNSNTIFCFYEGEDGKYYDEKIRRYSDDFYTIVAENKTQVLDTFRLISNKKEYCSSRKMFFIDRDFDDNTDYINEDIFITDGYSIENYYVNDSTLEKILQSEFSINKEDNDFKTCFDIFHDDYNEFNKLIVEFNALAKIRRQKKINVCLSNYKTKDLIKYDSKIEKSNKYDDKINPFKEKLLLEEGELERTVSDLLYKENCGFYFRGKNQLYFFKRYLKKIIKLNDDESLEIKHARVYLNLTNNVLSELSQYAYVSENLKEFLSRHFRWTDLYYNEKFVLSY